MDKCHLKKLEQRLQFTTVYTKALKKGVCSKETCISNYGHHSGSEDSGQWYKPQQEARHENVFWGPGQSATCTPILGSCWTWRSPEMSSNLSSPVTVWKTEPQCLCVIIYHILTI